jgi:hypothetical protein
MSAEGDEQRVHHAAQGSEPPEQQRTEQPSDRADPKEQSHRHGPPRSPATHRRRLQCLFAMG